MDIYSGCTSSTAKHTFAYVNIYDGSQMTLVIDSKLKSASFTGVDSNSTFTTESCIKICDTYNDTGPIVYANTGSMIPVDPVWNHGGTYCYYGNCTLTSTKSGPANLKATFTATEGPSNSSSTSSYSTQHYKSHTVTSGQDSTATGTISVTFSGKAYHIPSAANLTGDISTYYEQDTYTTF
jgi:hypothetical protein